MSKSATCQSKQNVVVNIITEALSSGYGSSSQFDPLNPEDSRARALLGLETPEDLALGGRVGYQEGTPEPMMEETVNVQETMQPEAPKENTMSVKQMYDLMRQRIPVANVSDKDLYKIASSEQIMADFASLETMSDVTQFNEQYDTNIVLDLPIVG